VAASGTDPVLQAPKPTVAVKPAGSFAPEYVSPPFGRLDPAQAIGGVMASMEGLFSGTSEFAHARSLWIARVVHKVRKVRKPFLNQLVRISPYVP